MNIKVRTTRIGQKHRLSIILPSTEPLEQWAVKISHWCENSIAQSIVRHRAYWIYRVTKGATRQQRVTITSPNKEDLTYFLLAFPFEESAYDQ